MPEYAYKRYILIKKAYNNTPIFLYSVWTMDRAAFFIIIALKPAKTTNILYNKKRFEIQNQSRHKNIYCMDNMFLVRILILANKNLLNTFECLFTQEKSRKPWFGRKKATNLVTRACRLVSIVKRPNIEKHGN